MRNISINEQFQPSLMNTVAVVRFNCSIVRFYISPSDLIYGNNMKIFKFFRKFITYFLNSIRLHLLHTMLCSKVFTFL